MTSCEIDGHHLAMKMLRPNRHHPTPDGPLEKKKIYVRNIPPCCKTDKFKSFLSTPAGSQVTKIEYAPRAGEAMVEFEAIPSNILVKGINLCSTGHTIL